jgi:toxin ParE1/3/4
VRIRLTRPAVSDLEQIEAFIRQDDPAAAAGMVPRVLEAMEVLTSFPAAGRAGRVPGTREMVVAGTPYIVPYRVRGDDVEVLRVLHASRRWPTRL